LTFGKTLPKLRKRIWRDMRRKRLDQRKVLATVVSLLETTLIRVGNEEYARSNGSFGLTTLKDRHVSFSKSETRFRFTGKTGKIWRLSVSDRRIARIVRSCQDLPGQHLFQYEAEDGSAHALKSDDVNGYLRDVAGDSEVSAKDFRTWAGTVLATVALSQFDVPASGASGKRNVRQAIGAVAVRLGNTPAICRKCYVHPEIVQCYLDGELHNLLPNITECALTPSAGEFSAAEKATLALLRRRLKGARRKRR
jgi:DNA topoisomerase-1